MERNAVETSPSIRPTTPCEIDPHAAWVAARASAELWLDETRRRREALRLQALRGPEDTRPTLPVPAPTYR